MRPSEYSFSVIFRVAWMAKKQTDTTAIICEKEQGMNGFKPLENPINLNAKFSDRSARLTRSHRPYESAFTHQLLSGTPEAQSS